MKTETMMKFKALFEQQKQNLVYSHKIMNDEFIVQKDEMLDDVDLTSCELEQAMRMRLRNREALFLKKIDEALDRIAVGTFGECEDCGDEIDLKRLEARPTCTLCIHCKEEQERREEIHIDGHKHKSLGQKMTLRLA